MIPFDPFTPEEEASKQALLNAYKETFDEEPDSMAEMICTISARRAATGAKWSWRLDKSTPNWSHQLHWG